MKSRILRASPTTPARWRSDGYGLAKLQMANGGWKNDSDHWMEADPNIVTGYAARYLWHTASRRSNMTVYSPLAAWRFGPPSRKGR